MIGKRAFSVLADADLAATQEMKHKLTDTTKMNHILAKNLA
jgi:hypothetical protein